jgi:hypothetical protein
MLMSVPETLTDAINLQPARIEIVALHTTSSTLREIPYSEIYRASTGVRETPAERLQRIADADGGVVGDAS